MKKIWKETLQEIILAIITLGINLLVKGKKTHKRPRRITKRGFRFTIALIIRWYFRKLR